MHPYVVSLILSAVVCGMLAGAFFVSKAPSRHSHVAALLLCCGAVWSLCQAFWCSASSPESAIALIRLSAVGWLPIGPLGLHLVIDASPQERPRLRRLIPWVYVVTAGFVLMDWLSPWLHTRAVATSWGYSYELGAGFIAAYGWVALVICPAIAMAINDFRRSPSPAERDQSSTIGIALSVPMGVASFTDGLCPLVGIPFPPMGGISITFLGVVALWSFWRYGYSVLIPTLFAGEILETLPEGVALLHLDGRIRAANRGMETLVGCRSRELENRHVDGILSPQLDSLLEEVRDLGCELVGTGGERIPVTLSTTHLHDKRDLLIGVVVVVHDQREIASLRNRLLVSGRLASVGELAAGVAHEINNPLAYVRSNLGLLSSHWRALRQLALEQASDSTPSQCQQQPASLEQILDEGEELFSESLEGVERATSIVQDIKGFSHAGSGHRETVDLNPLLDSVLRVAAPQLAPGVTIETQYAELPLITCAPQQLKQVFLNLVLNASQAIENAGKIEIESQQQGDEVVVRVRDNGGGIALEVLDRIFDPFFTTKPVGEGTGLGLAISYEIVRQHQGEIKVSSQSETGTCFEVRLPLKCEAA